MVNICVCGGCTNSSLSGHKVHVFPKKGTPAFRSWVRFVQVKRADFTASSMKDGDRHSVICGAHFRDADYIQGDLLSHRMGFRTLDQSSEVANSNWCEIEGLQRSIKLLKEQDLKVAVLVTDRNRQVAKWVRDVLCAEGTRHFFDIWHIAKSVSKKLDALSRERDCDVIKLWKQSFVNHLYWTAGSTPSGNADMMEAKWRSLVNHAQDIHEHDTPAFPACQHEPLEGEDGNKEWLEPGSSAAVQLEALVTKKLFLKDVRQRSPQNQTYSLEAFHSLMIRFAPKHTGFSFLGMPSRLLLAAMHYNHNGNRTVATTSAGEPRYAVSYPRFRKGEHHVHPIKDKPSYDYAFDLMGSLKDQYSRSSSALRAVSEGLAAAAPPIARTFQQVDKAEAVTQYLTQKSRFSSGHQDR